MARDLTAALEVETLAASLAPALFVEAQIVSGYVRFWTGYGSIEWNGETWSGAGHLLTISEPEETAELTATGISISLSGVPSDLLSEALAEMNREGLTCKVWLGALDATGAVIADPYKAFDGRIDVPEVLDDGSTATISVTVESRLIELERAPDRRYTAEDLQIDYPDDEFFAFVPSIQDKSITWGKSGQ